MAFVTRLPVQGWGVRPGGAVAHYFVRCGPTSKSACGSVSRSDAYTPRSLRPRQTGKPECTACRRALSKMAKRE